MAPKKTPERVDGVLRAKFGLALLLAQSEVVVRAFGRPLGFVIMMTALLVSATAVAVAIFATAKTAAWLWS
jgi:hypothetical protein